MTTYELERIRERIRISAIRNRGHLFSIAYRLLQETLKSKSFLELGRSTENYWPSYWHNKKHLPGDNLIIRDVDGKMNISVKTVDTSEHNHNS